MSDFSQRFLFSDSDIRGEFVSLTTTIDQVLAKHAYPDVVTQLLGELLAAASLLIGTLKFEGLLVLQARSSGPVSLVMVECSNKGELRGIAKYKTDQLEDHTSLPSLMPDGVLAMTIDPTKGQRYQGIVALDQDSLADCLSSYFATSEQLPTKFWLSADNKTARGFLLQQLPANRILDLQEREESWQHVIALANTLSCDELKLLDNQALLHRLYHEDTLTLFDPSKLYFNCSCSRERSAKAILALGQKEAKQILAEEQGKIQVDCQFCNQLYAFDDNDIAQLFLGGGIDSPSQATH
ncbi:UNVERIFIED_CONTAM: hypothetical protein GTU68_039031 [Idotea baltica]|nr:hypothetical protein [Idotea baltica]